MNKNLKNERLNLNQNNNNNATNSAISIRKIASFFNKKNNENDTSINVLSSLSLAQSDELPTKFIINNLKIKLLRFICLIFMKIVHFFAPPTNPTKEDKIFYIKK